MGSCHDKALELVARRPHFRRELEQKLVRRDFSAPEVAETLEKLAHAGLVDDAGHARDLAAGSMARKRFGPRRMRAELVRRGVDETVVDEVVSEAFPGIEEELSRARDLAARASSSKRDDPARVGRFLDRKGYSKSVILRILDELSDG